MIDSLSTNLVVTSPPSAEPVSLAEAKLHLRMDTITDDDALISTLISAAREFAERETWRAFVSRSYELRLSRFPCTTPLGFYPLQGVERLPSGLWGEIKIPCPPLLSIDSITYVDVNGNSVVLDPSQYRVELGGLSQGLVTPGYGLLFPPTRHQLDAVRIAFTAGYGDPTTVPASVKAAIKLLVGHWYRNRESVGTTALAEVPMAVAALLANVQWGGLSLMPSNGGPADVGALRHRVALQRASASPPSRSGQVVATPATVGTFWAYVETLTGRELVNARQVKPTVSHRITMRQVGPIFANDRLVYLGRVLNVDAVWRIDEQNALYMILATERPGETP